MSIEVRFEQFCQTERERQTERETERQTFRDIGLVGAKNTGFDSVNL